MPDKFELVDGVLYADGKPFTGRMYGRDYQEGNVVALDVLKRNKLL